ncbi:hypothetical protein SFRURICE_014042, partial [Spodoptera frugiperda]
SVGQSSSCSICSFQSVDSYGEERARNSIAMVVPLQGRGLQEHVFFNSRIYGWHGGWLTDCHATCSGFDSRTEQLFVWFTNCCFESGCHANVNLYVCKRTHDTGEITNVGHRFTKNNL